jgi:capsule polysaccharide export protein KpsE/RkpR
VRNVAYTISARAYDPDTAYLMAKHAFYLLDSAVQHVGSSRARNNRLFVERQLIVHRSRLDSLQAAFARFQTERKAYDIPTQVSLALQSYASVKAEQVMVDLKLENMRKALNGQSPDLRSLQEYRAVLTEKLAMMEQQESLDIFPSLRNASDLLPLYTNFILDIQIQTELTLLMRKELEQAKINEARDVTSLNIIDPAYVPAYKIAPRRLLLAGGIVAGYMALVMLYIALSHCARLWITRSPHYHEIRDLFSAKQ